MAEISSLIVKLRSEGASQVNKDLAGVKSHGAGAEKSVTGLTSSVKKLAAAAGGVISVTAAFQKLVETGRETGILNTQLQTATGSAENAKAAFAALQSLTTELPTTLNETTKAFTTLINRGLEPTREAIISYANTAAANGKSLDQFIEAIADATTFEFERLKEFGIKAKQVGENVELTFRGQTTTIKKSSEEIEGYLQRLGNVEFAGAATRQMETLDGKISNLGEAWDGLFRTINDQGAGELIADSVTIATDAIQTLNDLLASGALQQRIENIGTAFSEAFYIGDMAEAFLLTWGETLDATEYATAETVDFIIDAFKDWPENVSTLVKLVAIELGYLVDVARLKAQEIAEAVNPANWLDDDLVEVNERLTRAIASRDKLLSAGLNDSIPVVKALNKQIKDLTAEQTELNAELKKQEDRYAAIDKARDDSIAGILNERDAQTKLAKDREKHSEKLLKNYKDQQAAAKSLNEVVAEIPKTIKETGIQTAETTETTIRQFKELEDKADDYAKAWENAIERIDAAFADAWKGAFDSFEEFADSLLDAFKDLAGEIAHINITKPLTDQLAGAFSGGGGLNLGLSGLFGGSGASAGKGGQAVIGADPALGQAGLTASLQGGFIAAGATLTANAIATLFDDNASNARRRNNLALLTGGLGALIPSSIFGKPTDSTQKATYDLSTGAFSDTGSLTGDKFSQQNRDAADYAALVAYNLADYLQGKTGNQVADSLGLVVGNRDGIRAEINGNEIARGTDAGEVLSSLTDELLRLSGISGDVYKALSQDGEELYQTLVRVDDQFVVVSAITDKLHLNFGALGDAGLVASDALVQAAGGLESLVAKTDYYYQNFYSEEERLQNIIDNSTGALAEFNASMGTAIDDRGGLREFVDALDLTTEAGQAAYAAALDLAPALVDLGTAQERLAEITKPTLVAMEDAAENWGDAVVVVADEISEAMQKLTAQANDFAGGIARDAVLEGLSGYERDVFLLDEWKTQALAQLEDFTAQGVAILGGPEKVLSDIEKIYAIRLGDIASKYTQSVIVIDEFVESSDDLSNVLADVIDNTEYLAELEQRRTDAINAVSQAYERESSALEHTRDQFADFAKSLRDFDKSLLTGELSTLNPEQQYRESKNQFGDLARRAGLGDTDAIAQLQSSGSSFLQESREFQGSAGSYASDFDFVRQTLANTISLSDRQASNAEQQLEQMKAQVSATVRLEEEVKTLKDALAVLVQVEREAGSQMIAQQRQTNATLDGLKSNSDLQATA